MDLEELRPNNHFSCLVVITCNNGLRIPIIVGGMLESHLNWMKFWVTLVNLRVTISKFWLTLVEFGVALITIHINKINNLNRDGGMEL